MSERVIGLLVLIVANGQALSYTAPSIREGAKT
jgi:hypothetical protein